VVLQVACLVARLVVSLELEDHLVVLATTTAQLSRRSIKGLPALYATRLSSQLFTTFDITITSNRPSQGINSMRRSGDLLS
jgi:hypothetical protein